MRSVAEPARKRAVAFVDGQNLIHAVEDCFGYPYPNFDIKALTTAVALSKGWDPVEARFYTGIHDSAKNPKWHGFWTRKLLAMSRQHVEVWSRTLRYSNGFGEEKGTDIRIALDAIRLTRNGMLDVAVIFSQDQDLSEVADEIRLVAGQMGRWVKVASAFPISRGCRNPRGINRTDWIEIDRSTYDACLDGYDYFADSGAKATS